MTTKQTRIGKGLTAIYVRRSVADRDNNSLSIEAQKEDCLRFIGADCAYQIYCDNGFSGKDTEHRPAFQTMMQDARDGLISRIVVKKYDRFSRNLRDYLNVSEELDRLGVTVYSLSEPFNTETKEGRMMRNNLLNFAEFERETIAARVADAYNTRGRETGFYQGGVMCFGYAPERKTVNGKTGSVLVPSEQAEALKLAFTMYAEPHTSLRGIIQHFREHEDEIQYMRTDRYGGKNDWKHNGKLNVSSLSNILSNPLYVRADKNVYSYFQTKGYEIIDGIDAFDGIHGLFLHDNGDGNKYVKVGYHEGLVDADVWLRVQYKKDGNVTFSTKGTAVSSWLVGLVKCKECGYGVLVDRQFRKRRNKTYRYLVDNGYGTYKGCVGRSYPIRIDDLEDLVFEEMKKRLETIEIARRDKESVDPEAESIKAEIIEIDGEIRSLMDKMAKADDVVFAYIQQRIKELHAKKTDLDRRLHNKERKQREIESNPLSEPLSLWDTLTVQEKHDLAEQIIEVIYISHNSEEVNIVFGV
mgnify:FL=1